MKPFYTYLWCLTLIIYMITALFTRYHAVDFSSFVLGGAFSMAALLIIQGTCIQYDKDRKRKEQERAMYVVWRRNR